MAQALHLDSRVAKRSSPGFTLIELMIVVVIVGILATLAVVGYRKLVQSSHVSEATNMVQNIRVAQEAYHSETQAYANISKGFPTGNGPLSGGFFYPLATPLYETVTGWGATCTWCNMDWSVLPLHVDGPVMFGYVTISNAATAGTLPANITVDGSSVAVTQPATDWNAIGAEEDLDGVTTTVTDVFAFSWTNQVFVSNEGQ